MCVLTNETIDILDISKFVRNISTTRDNVIMINYNYYMIMVMQFLVRARAHDGIQDISEN